MPDEPQQPVAATPTPAPVAPPVQQWAEQPPSQAQVQYVVAKQSLDGLGGWLMFWLIVFALSGLAYIGTFFSNLGEGSSDVLLTVFSLILSVGFLASVVFIALRKKLGKLVSMATIGAMTLYTIISGIITSVNDSANLGSAVGGIVASAVFGGLLILYFVASKRVKATLVN